MAIADFDELLEVTTPLLAGIATSLPDAVLERCAEYTMSELQWSLPLSDSKKEYWAIERCRRHIISALQAAAAMKFQYKQIHLEHRFKHLTILIEKLDEQFAKAIYDYPELFVDLTSTYSDVAYYITSGFTYDKMGIEL